MFNKCIHHHQARQNERERCLKELKLLNNQKLLYNSYFFKAFIKIFNKYKKVREITCIVQVHCDLSQLKLQR